MQRSRLVLALLVAVLAGGWWFTRGGSDSQGEAARLRGAEAQIGFNDGEDLFAGGRRSGEADPSGDREAVEFASSVGIDARLEPDAPELRVRVMDYGAGRALTSPRVELVDSAGTVKTLGVGEEIPWSNADMPLQATTPSKGWILREPRFYENESLWILPLEPRHTLTLAVRDSVTDEFVTGLEGELYSFDYRRSERRTTPLRIDQPRPFVFHGFHFAGRGMVSLYLEGPEHAPSYNSDVPIGLGANELTDRVHSHEFGMTPLSIEVVQAGLGAPLPGIEVVVFRDERDEINHVEMGSEIRPTGSALHINEYTVWQGRQRTNDQGRVELPVEAPARYRVALHSDQGSDLLGDSFHVPLGEPFLRRFELPASASLFGTITVDGAYAEESELFQLSVLALRGANFDYVEKLHGYQELYDMDGPPESFDHNYTLDGLAPGTYRYLLSGYPDPREAQLFDLRLASGEVTLVAGETQRLDIHVDGSALSNPTSSGVAVRGTWSEDYVGRARPDAVMLLSLEAGSENELRSPITRAIAGATGVDSQGRFELPAIQPGRYLLLGQGRLEDPGEGDDPDREQLMASSIIEVGDADLDVTLRSGPRTVCFVHTAEDPGRGGKLYVGLGAPEGPRWLDTLLRNGEMGVRRGGEFSLHGLPDVPLVSVYDGVETSLADGREVTVELE